MGNQRTKGSKGAHAGAPLTHRQQKQQRRAPKQQRQAQAQTMPSTQHELRHQPQMRTAPHPQNTPQPAVHLDTGAIAVASSSSDASVNSPTIDITDLEAVAAEKVDSKAADVAAAQSASDETTPPRSRIPRGAARRKADAPTEPSEHEMEPATSPAPPSARKRPTRQTAKYPTLARMAAIAPATPPISASSPAHPAISLDTAPLSAADLHAATISATHTHEADVEDASTANVSPQVAMRAAHAQYRDDINVRRAITRDSATEADEPRAVLPPRKPVTTRRLAGAAEADEPPTNYEPRKPVTTRRLADASESTEHPSSDAPARRLESAAARAIAGAREARRQASQVSRNIGMQRPRTLPEIDLVMPVAATHIVVAFAAALTGAIILVVGQEWAFWPFALAVVLGVGAWLAYLASQRSTAKSFAGSALLASQLAALCWLFALFGARASLLALAPAILLLALRTAGRLAMMLGTVATFALYIAAVLFLPALPISRPDFLTTELAVVDGVVVFVGLLALLVLALDLQNGHTRALARARASRHEARLLRERTALLRQQLEEDATLLDERLGEALHGRGISPAALEQVDSMLSPLVERVNDIAGRLETLQRDREDRLRLEGAVRQVTRALERGWLGLPWSWPESSDTLLDELVALLRAPNPRQMPLWRDEMPSALVPIPSLDSSLTPRPWDTVDTPVINPYARPEMQAGWPAIANHPSLPDQSDHHAITARGISGAVWPAPIRSDGFAQRPALDPSLAPVRANPLPWDEWDTWGTWDAARRDS